MVDISRRINLKSSFEARTQIVSLLIGKVTKRSTGSMPCKLSPRRNSASPEKQLPVAEAFYTPGEALVAVGVVAVAA